MLELFPHGFEEIDRSGGVELVGYTDAAGEELFLHTFSGARGSDVEPGWEERWREFHRPVWIGPLWVGPPWEVFPPGAVPVVIDPGRAFGTGGHATTRLCLELLLELTPASLLDIGCGSGVLAIAATALGFGPVVAIDSDSAAVEAARANAQLNGARLEVRLADALTDKLPAAEVAVANLTLETLAELGPRLESSAVVTSGYLASERPSLPGCQPVLRRETEGWAADLHERKTP